MLASIHINDAVRVRPADIENVNPLQFWKIDELHTVRREKLSRASRRLAACVRFKLILEPVVVNTLGPGLPWHLADFRFLWGPGIGRKARECRGVSATAARCFVGIGKAGIAR